MAFFAAGIFYVAAEYVPAKIEPQPERYVLPVTVFLSVLCAAGLQLTATRPRLFRTLSFVCLSYPILTTLMLAADLRVDTRSRMAEWIGQNLPAGERIYVEYLHYSVSHNSALPVEYKVLSRSGHAYAEGKAFLKESLQSQGVRYFLISSFTLYDFLHNPEAPREYTIRARSLLETGTIVHTEKAHFTGFGFHNPDLFLIDVW